MRKKKVHVIASESFAPLFMPDTAYQAAAQAATIPSATTRHAKMAPVDEYLGAGLTAGSASRLLLK